MDILTVLLVVVLVIIVLGLLLGKLTWESGIRWIVIIAVLALLIYFILTRLG